MNIYKLKNSVVIEDVTDEEIQEIQKIKKISTENFENEKNILPRPMIYEKNSFNPNFNGKKFNFYSPNAFQLRLMQEIIQMTKVFNTARAGVPEYYDTVADYLADIITLCITEMSVIGYDENKRSELFAKVNARNEKLGCLKELDEK